MSWVRGALAFAVMLAGACESAPAYDVVLTGGTVVDGTGAAAVVADVALVGDTIAAIGPDLTTGGAITVIDVRGRVVAPGFRISTRKAWCTRSEPVAHQNGWRRRLAPIPSTETVD